MVRRALSPSQGIALVSGGGSQPDDDVAEGVGGFGKGRAVQPDASGGLGGAEWNFNKRVIR